MYDGIKQIDATRALLSVSSGRGHHTRFQRCWRYGAALDVWTWSLSGEGPNPDVLAGGTTSRSCRRTPRVSPLLQFGATLRSPGSPYPATRCELRAGSLAFARMSAASHLALPIPHVRRRSTIRPASSRRYVEAYQRSGDVGVLLDQLKALAKRTRARRSSSRRRQPFRDMPEVVIPLYERIVADAPNDAQAMVVLANAYWLTGRGPDAVEQLATRAKADRSGEPRRLAPLGARRVGSCESASIDGSR